MIAAVFALALLAAPQDQPPPVCVGATFVSWEACAEATPEGSATHALALINLGNQAYELGDYEKALGFYDKAQGPGAAVVPDAVLHAYRADIHARAGRREAARADATTAWTLLNAGPGEVRPMDDDGRFVVLHAIVPILKDGDPAVFEQAVQRFIALPANHWVALSNRAVLLANLERFDLAVADTRRAVELAPAEPGVLNDHCYFLTRAGRPAEGLWACERAIELLPENGAVRHSYAAALAGEGRCEEAERQLAEARRLSPTSALYRQPLACTPKG